MQSTSTVNEETAESLRMGVRFVPSMAGQERFSARSTVGVRATDEVVRAATGRSGASKISTQKWREGAREQPFRRCLSSATSALLGSMAVLVAVSVTAVWVPSAILANDELEAASEAQLTVGAEQASKEVLGYMQTASSTGQVITEMYAMAHAAAPDNAPKQFHDEFGESLWGMLVQAGLGSDPLISWALVGQARSASLINPDDPTCNTDVTFMSTIFKANLNSETTGTGIPANDTSVAPNFSTDRAPAGMARANFINGAQDLSDPIGASRLMFFVPCSAGYGSLGSVAGLWDLVHLPGDVGQLDTGIRQPTWLPGTVAAGGQSLFKTLVFPLQGPASAPLSAFGAISLRVSAPSDDSIVQDDYSINKMLRTVAKLRDSSVLFLLTSEGNLLATSLEGQRVEQLDSEGAPVDLLPGDSEQVQEPVRSVAKKLLADHCSVGPSGGRVCNWAAVPDGAEENNGFFVAASMVNDDKAAGLDMLLVNMIDANEVWGASRELNYRLGTVGSVILLVACLFAVVLSRIVTAPFRFARDNMFFLGDMHVEDVLQRNLKGNRLRFTETSDLQASFFHAATCLKAWREHEMERRVQLEEDRASRIQKAVERSVQGAGKLVHPMVLISADAFSKLEQLTSYEELRNTSKLVFLDSEESLALFRADHSIVFLSHQWLAWGYPDNATKTHLNAMKKAIQSAAERVGDGNSGRTSWENLYVWVDYCSIAQEHRGMQMLAVSSLPVYASSADIFVIVAPPAEHQSSRRCDLQSYNARGWCRAEMLAKICSSGLQNFFVFEESGLEPITEERLPSLSMYVFEGEFSCCQQRHLKTSCDKEALVEPVLGLYSLVLRQVRAGVNKEHMKPILQHIHKNKERFFPSTYRFHKEGSAVEERELFGPLVSSTEKYVQDLSVVNCAISFDSWLGRPATTASKSASGASAGASAGSV